MILIRPNFDISNHVILATTFNDDFMSLNLFNTQWHALRNIQFLWRGKLLTNKFIKQDYQQSRLGHLFVISMVDTTT